jgi:hypothetical protein
MCRRASELAVVNRAFRFMETEKRRQENRV